MRGPGFVVGGMAKGAAMLAPNMATMLAVLTTDADAEPAELQARCSDAGVADSFNLLTIDGCTSTNDTVLLLASGRRGRIDRHDLHAAVIAACDDLARQMAGDAEGATKVVRVTRHGRGHGRRRATRRPQGGREPAGQVLVVRQGPVLGPHRERAR